MAIKIVAELEGFDRTARKLEAISAGGHRKAARRAMRSAMAPVRKAVKVVTPRKNSTPYATGSLRKALQIKIVTNKRDGSVTGVVGARSRKLPNGKNPSRYIHLVEKGTRRGAPAQRILERGWSSSKSAAESIFRDRYRETIEAEAKRG